MNEPSVPDQALPQKRWKRRKKASGVRVAGAVLVTWLLGRAAMLLGGFLSPLFMDTVWPGHQTVTVAFEVALCALLVALGGRMGVVIAIDRVYLVAFVAGGLWLTANFLWWMFHASEYAAGLQRNHLLWGPLVSMLLNPLALCMGAASAKLFPSRRPAPATGPT